MERSAMRHRRASTIWRLGARWCIPAFGLHAPYICSAVIADARELVAARLENRGAADRDMFARPHALAQLGGGNAREYRLGRSPLAIDQYADQFMPPFAEGARRRLDDFAHLVLAVE